MIKKKSYFGFIAIILCIVAIIGSVFVTLENSSGISVKDEIKLAEEYMDKKLYFKAVNRYEAILKEKDSEDIRVAQLNALSMGVETGEFNHSVYESYLGKYLSKYYDSKKAYELALDYYFGLEDYEKCKTLFSDADKYGVNSKKINEYRNKLSRKYSLISLNYSKVTPFRNYMASVSYDGCYGLIDDTGMIYADIVYNSISPCYFVTDNKDETRYWGFFKTDEYTYLANSNLIRQQYLPNEIESSTGIGDELLSCKIGNKYCYYNIDGEPVFNKKTYEYASKFITRIAAVRENDNWYFINNEGNKILNEAFADIKLNALDECVKKQTVFAKKDFNGQYFAYKYTDGKLVQTKVAVDDVDLPPNGNCDLIAYKSNGKWGYMDTELNVIIEPKYQEAKSFSAGYAGAKINDKWTVINTKGESVIDSSDEITEVSYFSVYELEDGSMDAHCFVRINGNWQLMKLYLV